MFCFPSVDVDSEEGNIKFHIHPSEYVSTKTLTRKNFVVVNGNE